MRIVSLIPSGTEIVSALGRADQLVGRSHECDYPASVVDLPACTAPKFDPEGSSAEIDERVREILQNALAVYSVDENKLRDLAPDVIVTQTQCEICAVSALDVQRTVSQWVGTRSRIVTMEAGDIDGLWADIESLSLALSDLDTGNLLTARLKMRMADIAGAVPSLGVEQPTVVCIEWFDPLMTAGNWVPELVSMAGGKSQIGQAGQHSGTIEWHHLLAADPDVIVLRPCGFDQGRTVDEARGILFDRTDWQHLRAVRNDRVFATDGNHFFNRPGPRLVESLEILAEILHPDQFDFGHRGVAWKRIS